MSNTGIIIWLVIITIILIIIIVIGVLIHNHAQKFLSQIPLEELQTQIDKLNKIEI